MNIVIISGQIISNIDFKFIYTKQNKDKHISIAMCKMQLDNGSIIDIYGYDDIADCLYKMKNKYIYIEGILDNNMMVEIINWG